MRTALKAKITRLVRSSASRKSKASSKLGNGKRPSQLEESPKNDLKLKV